MNIRLIIYCACLSLLSSSIASSLDLASLRFFGADYKADSYIGAAMTLQTMGRDVACQTLLDLNKTNRNDWATIVLCRMLFTQRGTNEFRLAYTGFRGGPAFTYDKDWPLWPITLVDGIPFKVVYQGGGANGGGPETGSSYLCYCMTNCDWNSFQFHKPTSAQKRAALDKLVSLSIWRRLLNDYERESLSKQIE